MITFERVEVSEDDLVDMSFKYNYSNVQDGWNWVKRALGGHNAAGGIIIIPPASCNILDAWIRS